ncbi:MAG TPA: DUF3291 domain-containing protein [Hyphomonadaceae bacterium]|jgi:hypothetical protein|nr:DUF3291 domain-containing protein [Hyphomonadaceae bacterium]
MINWHIAQINYAIFRVDRADPVNADFEAALDEVNALAEAAPGFIWRMQGEGENEDPQITTNMTVWDGIETLSAFAYRNLTHRGIMRRRKEWFIDLPSYLALWWLPAGTTPTLSEGRAKLDLIARLGPTQEAFDFRTPFPPPLARNQSS